MFASNKASDQQNTEDPNVKSSQDERKSSRSKFMAAERLERPSTLLKSGLT